MSQSSFVCSQLNSFEYYYYQTLIVLFAMFNGFKNCYLILMIQFNINNLYAHS